jgi:hypothetical protein
MAEAWELFNNLMEKDFGIHVELGDDAKYVVKVREISCSILIQVVLWNPKMCYIY